MLDFQNISIQRKGKKVLDDFSLKAPDGVILALLGEDKEGNRRHLYRWYLYL